MGLPVRSSDNPELLDQRLCPAVLSAVSGRHVPPLHLQPPFAGPGQAPAAPHSSQALSSGDKSALIRSW